MTKGFDIRPEAVRVWRGYRASGLESQKFLVKLGAVFVPATVEMQIAAGLDGYVPSILAELPNKPDTVPDETAILFWDSQQTYRDSFNTLAIRTYNLTHGSIYRPPSTAEFPEEFRGALGREQPYYLINRPCDWMHGKVKHLVGGRPDSVTPEGFRTSLEPILTSIQRHQSVSGAIVCAGDDYLVYWEVDAAASDNIEALKSKVSWLQVFEPTSSRLTSGLWDSWPGMTIKGGTSLNMRFKRRWESFDRNTHPVAPDAVHVWRGYKTATLSDQEFVSFLGEVFLPAALLLQPGAGLHAYIPSITPGGGGGLLPDQTALMFWADQQNYREAYGTVAVRAYKGLHGRAFDEPPSKTGWPIAFTGTVVAEQPYYLFDRAADWMLGSVRYFIGTRPQTQSAGDFLKSLARWVAAFLETAPLEIDGAIICAGSTYVVFWEHATPGAPANSTALTSLSGIATRLVSRTAETYTPLGGLWSQWPGIDLNVHGCINVQLDRRFHDPLHQE